WAAINELTRDTGRRNVTSYLINGWTASEVTVQRVRDRVYFRFQGLNGTSATSTRMMDFSGSGIGTGFSPPSASESPALRTGSTYDMRLTVSLTGGISGPTGYNLGTSSAREFSWPCEASWPSPLPGTAV